ncbi:hypothetical protein NEOLEDRAFT_144799 [Neolentinus lepideus HHB14362 ss-1]|uniref:Serine-threonine/tyrosine-protein kinase catalytic domain-containing protein n=1 Tax=Neolentinus lepideus HHB14362 ss-1 TaxID=1314782 RepID=A0A165U0T9_9AGAM|nr:hypothetical protein NEOLEDRAFT_144799 [Neolentinus lepideus HHB14362 ss-1]
MELLAEHGQEPHGLLIKEKIVIGEYPVSGGASTDVFQASLRDEWVAVNRLRAPRLSVESSIQLRKNLLREAVIWHRLRHDNILPFLGIKCDASTSMFCMISPWMKNGTIIRFLDKHANVNVNDLTSRVA